MRKDLVERKNDLQEKMKKIADTAKAENRAVTNEEKDEFNKMKDELSNIEETAKIDEMTLGMDLEKSNGKEETQEDKDIHTFANMIRTIRNTATQMSTDSNGVLIPKTIANKIIDAVTDISPIFASATKYHEKGSLIIPLVNKDEDDVTVAYADEFSDLVEHSNKFASVELKEYLVGALTKISKSLLKNSDFDLVNYVVNRMALKFKIFFEREIILGTSGKITGIIGSYDSKNMKITLAKKSSIQADELIDIQESVPDAYQAGAGWIMNRQTRKDIRKLKDNDGKYILNQVFGQAWDYELLGKPVSTTDSLDKLGTAGKPVILYGDFSGVAVNVPEDIEITVLTELFAMQHALGVVGYAELDAKVENTQKIAVAVTGASDTVA